MKTKHTPGPYSLSGIPGDNHIMALPALHQPCARVNVAIVPGWRGITPEEHEANKRLLAAAPDLLSACQAILDCDSETEDMGGDWGSPEWCGWVGQAIEQARAAIAQATGEK